MFSHKQFYNQSRTNRPSEQPLFLSEIPQFRVIVLFHQRHIANVFLRFSPISLILTRNPNPTPAGFGDTLAVLYTATLIGKRKRFPPPAKAKSDRFLYLLCCLPSPSLLTQWPRPIHGPERERERERESGNLPLPDKNHREEGRGFVRSFRKVGLTRTPSSPTICGSGSRAV